MDSCKCAVCGTEKRVDYAVVFYDRGEVDDLCAPCAKWYDGYMFWERYFFARGGGGVAHI